MLSDEERNRLHDQLIKLGDMMGDGLHHEADGRWISTEYRKVCKALGYIKPKKRNVEGINKRINEKLIADKCPKCEGQLKQTRSGSLKVKCESCQSIFVYKKSKKNKSSENKNG